MSSWGCPHENDGACLKVMNLPCDPGMKGCVLHGRFTFSNSAKNRPPRPATQQQQQARPPRPRTSK